jgi:hypothetical protein
MHITPTNGTVVEIGSLPRGTVVTALTIYGWMVGRITRPGEVESPGRSLRTFPTTLVVVGEHYDTNGAIMLPVGPVRPAVTANGAQPGRQDSPADVGTVQCHECGKTHPAEFSHISDHGGHRVFAVVCDDDLTDYYTEEAVTF